MWMYVFSYMYVFISCKCDSQSQGNVNVDIRSYNGPYLQVLEAGYACLEPDAEESNAQLTNR